MFLFLVTSYSGAKTVEKPPTVYRAIRTSPQDFVYALKAPAAPEAPRGTSRLDRFFRIKKKQVDGSVVRIEIIPAVPMLAKYFPDTTTVRIEVRQMDLAARDFETRIEALGKRFISAAMHVDPSPVGSLLSLTLQESNYGDNVISVFMTAAKALGFVHSSPSGAEKHGSSPQQSQHPPSEHQE